MSKRQRRTVGSIIKINLGEGYHSYGRILDKANYAFYNIRTQEEILDLKTIVSSPILFIVAVYDDAITSGRWPKIGKLELEDSLISLPFKFIQDAHTGIVELYNSNTGEVTKVSKEKAAGLECAAVWEANHVEDRLRDHFSNKPNIWVDRLKLK